METLITELPITAQVAGNAAEAASQLCNILTNGDLELTAEQAILIADRMQQCGNMAAHLELIVARAENGMEFHPNVTPPPDQPPT